MAWTNPKTWSVGELVTAANLNTHVRDNLNVIGEHLYARSTSNVDTANDATVNDDTQLFVPLSASVTYIWDAIIPFSSPTTSLLRLTWTVPTGATGSWHISASGLSYTDAQVAYGTEITTSTASGTTRPVHFGGVVVMSTTAGNLLLRWSQAVSNATATRRGADGFLIARRIA